MILHAREQNYYENPLITSRHNPEMKRLYAFSQKKGKEEEFFLVEGEREIAHAKEVEALYYSVDSPWAEEMELRGVPIKKVHRDLLSKYTYREGQPLAIVKKFFYTKKSLSAKSLLLLVEGVEKPGNLGAILRTAEGAGVEGILLCSQEMDPFHPNVIRASLGAFFRLPFLLLAKEETKQFLQQEEMQIVVTSPHATQPYFSLDFCKPTCIVMGSEAYGVTSLWEKEALSVQIPMKGKIDSLNVSVATGVILYEVVRQRYGNPLSR